MWTEQLGERGTDVALFDYADYAERLLKLTVWVYYDASCARNFAGCVAKFRSRFGERLVGLRDGWAGVDPALRKHGVRHLYALKVNHDLRVSRLPGVRTRAWAL